MPNASYSAAVISAGASGLMCAIEAAKRGKKICIIEHNEEAGKKIAISGGGRCNFTNTNINHSNYISSNPNFTKSALARFTPNDFTNLLNKHRIPFIEEENGKLFCSRGSKDILS